MKGLLIKDFYCALQYVRTYVIMMIFFFALGFAMQSPSYVIFMGVFMGFSIVLGSFSMDELGGFAYCLSMPFTRRQVVQGKFLFLMAESVAVFLLSLALSLILCILTGESAAENLWSGMYSNIYFLVLMALLIPIALKWGLERARMFMLVFVVLPAVAIVAAERIGPGSGFELLDNLLNSPGPVLAVSVVFAAAVFLISYRISLGIFEKKEF